jgi:hypothetical protein
VAYAPKLQQERTTYFEWLFLQLIKNLQLKNLQLSLKPEVVRTRAH